MLKYHPYKKKSSATSCKYFSNTLQLRLHDVEINTCQHNGHEQEVVSIVLILEWLKSDSEQIV